MVVFQTKNWRGKVVCMCVYVRAGEGVYAMCRKGKGKEEVDHSWRQGTQRKVNITRGLLLLAEDSNALRLLGPTHLTCSSLPSYLPSKSVLRFHFSMELSSLLVSTKSAFIQPVFV